MIHTCNVHCHAMEPDQVDMMGIKDPGKWLPFAFHMDIVVACKQTTDESDHLAYNCTTIFAEYDSYIIDTPYKEFIKIFQDYHNNAPSQDEDLDF